MTPELIAQEIVLSEDIAGANRRWRLQQAIEQAIKTAIEEERESCAKIAEEASQKSSWANIPLEFGEAGKTIAGWIRRHKPSASARSSEPGETLTDAEAP